MSPMEHFTVYAMSLSDVINVMWTIIWICAMFWTKLYNMCEVVVVIICLQEMPHSNTNKTTPDPKGLQKDLFDFVM